MAKLLGHLFCSMWCIGGDARNLGQHVLAQVIREIPAYTSKSLPGSLSLPGVRCRSGAPCPARRKGARLFSAAGLSPKNRNGRTHQGAQAVAESPAPVADLFPRPQVLVCKGTGRGRRAVSLLGFGPNRPTRRSGATGFWGAL